MGGLALEVAFGDEYAFAGGDEVAQALLRQRVEAAEMGQADHASGGVPIRVTISVGVAGYSDELSNGQSLIQAADQALYQAKQAGRNRTATAQGIPEPQKPAS